MRITDRPPSSTRGRGARGRGRGQREANYDCVETRPKDLVNKKGTSGKPIALYTNYLGFKKTSDNCLFKYRVDFKTSFTDELDTWSKKTVFARLDKKLPPFLFDGSMAYLTSKIEKLAYTSGLTMKTGGDKPVQVELRMISELHPSDNDYVHVRPYYVFYRSSLYFLRTQIRD